MEKVQAKLKECVEKQSMNSLDRLSATLGTGEAPDSEKLTMEVEEAETNVPAIEASETTGMLSANDYKGENKAPISRRSRWKKSRYRKTLNEQQKKPDQEHTKRRPKYYCKF